MSQDSPRDNRKVPFPGNCASPTWAHCPAPCEWDSVPKCPDEFLPQSQTRGTALQEGQVPGQVPLQEGPVPHQEGLLPLLDGHLPLLKGQLPLLEGPRPPSGGLFTRYHFTSLGPEQSLGPEPSAPPTTAGHRCRCTADPPKTRSWGVWKTGYRVRGTAMRSHCAHLWGNKRQGNSARTLRYLRMLLLSIVK